MTEGLFWSGANSRRITERIVIEADLRLMTPASFGGGDNDDLTDMPLLVDAADGYSPLLTGATLAGALRAYLGAREAGFRTSAKDIKPATTGSKRPKSLTELLFGGFKADDDGLQSALIVDDARGESPGVLLRDGVRLDPRSRTAEHGKLFNMEAWPPGTLFPLRLELLLARPRVNLGTDYHASLKEALFVALTGLTDGTITLGGRKRRGFGRFCIDQWRIKQFDLTTVAGLYDWLQHGNQSLPGQTGTHLATTYSELVAMSLFGGIDPASLDDHRSYFRLEATFKLDGSLLIRANGELDSTSPDMVHLSYADGTPVLPGTSVAGALRQRARRILGLLRPQDAPELLNSLFGDEKMHKKAHASRLIVEESRIEAAQFDLVQNRVAIDRFTGGAFETALFNEQPVFAKPETKVYINLTVRQPKEHDIGLILLLLKDLWTGDLPLGGESSIGRGRLVGERAVLHLVRPESQMNWQVDAEGREGRLKIVGDPADALQKYVTALHERSA